MIINPYIIGAPPASLFLKLNFGDTGMSDATGWSSIEGEPNPDEGAGTITSARGGVYASWGNIEGSGVSITVTNGGTVGTRWGIFGGASASNTNGQNRSGTGDTSGESYPAEVPVSYWFVNASTGTLNIIGLDDGETYTITCMGSRDSGVGGSRRSIFTIDGNVKAAVECIGNPTAGGVAWEVQQTGCTPSSGVIVVTLVNDNNSLAYLSGLIIEQE